MLLAYDYPLLSIVLSLMWFFIWVLWLMTLFHVIGDIFRSRDIGGAAKTGWLVLVLFVPFLGVFVYVVARGDRMNQHAVEDLEARDAMAQDYIRRAAGSTDVADQMAKLAAMRADGAISEADYEAAKTKILAT